MNVWGIATDTLDSRRSETGQFALFAAERLHRVSGGGTTGGDPGCDERGGRDCRRDADENGEVPGADAEEEAPEQAPGEKRGAGADDESEENEISSFTEDEPADGRTLRPESHADADFAGALSDGIGDDAIQTNDS